MDVRFAHPSELALARVFDRHGIAWRYEPHTFVLERDADGTVRQAFTPDFFLPELGVYVECTVMRQALTRRKRRKARLTAERTGALVEIMFRRDFERLGRRWGLTELADAGRSDGEVSAHRGVGKPFAAVSESARMLERRESFNVEVGQSSDAAVVTVRGDVDLHSAPLLRDQLSALVDEGAPVIVLDLSDATFLDSMALGVILSVKKLLAAEQRRLEVVVPTPEIRRIFEITMLDRVLDLHETQAEALRASASGDAAL
jgi:anti-anti-sigma factor